MLQFLKQMSRHESRSAFFAVFLTLCLSVWVFKTSFSFFVAVSHPFRMRELGQRDREAVLVALYGALLVYSQRVCVPHLALSTATSFASFPSLGERWRYDLPSPGCQLQRFCWELTNTNFCWCVPSVPADWKDWASEQEHMNQKDWEWTLM